MLRAPWWYSFVLHLLVACWQRQWGDLCLRLLLVDKEHCLLQLLRCRSRHARADPNLEAAGLDTWSVVA